jgi:hypothetical protein
MSELIKIICDTFSEGGSIEEVIFLSFMGLILSKNPQAHIDKS